MKSKTVRHLYSTLIIIILTSLAYTPGIGDFWVADDIPNIVINQSLQIESLDSNSLLGAASANESGPLKRPLSSLSFALNYYFSGKQLIASDFKATNLAIHITNGILVYLIAFHLIKILSASRQKHLPFKAIALFIACVWALHPIQLTAVLYPVQRMASLSAMFVFAGLLLYIIGRTRLSANKPYALTQMYAGIALGTLLGALCKENALLLPYLALAIELTLFSKLAITEKKLHKRVIIFYTITVIIPAILALLYLATHPGRIMDGYAARDFTLTERLMTEARIQFIYLKQLLYPVLSHFSLHHDNIAISKGMLQPWTTLVSTIAIFLLATFSLLKRKTQPILSFAILWFFIAHAMESTIFALLPMYEHRNYVASFSIAFCTCYYIYVALGKLSTKTLFRIAPPIIIILCLAFITHTRSEIWSTENSLTYFGIKNNPDSSIAQSERAKYILQSYGSPIEAYEHLRISSKLDHSNPIALMTMQKILTAIRLEIENNRKIEEPKISMQANYYSPFIENGNYITQLHPLINEEIEFRLRNGKISAGTTLALRAHSDCATSGKNPPCEAIINDIIKWTEITLKNQSVSPKQRAIIHTAHAKIRAYLGDIDGALEDLDLAYQEQPDEVYLLIEKLTLLIALKDWENAKKLIETIDSHQSLSTHHIPHLERAKHAYKLESAPAPTAQ